MTSSRRLVVNADDFGFTRDVNEGIIEAHRKGILTAATLMTGGGAFDDAVRLAREYPSLDVGCHLMLVGGRSALDPRRRLPRNIPSMMTAVASRRFRIYDELAAQVCKILEAGIRPTHLDTHKHTHMAPAVLEAVARLAGEFGIRWVRRPFDFPMGSLDHVPWLVRLTSRALRPLRGRFQAALERHGCRTTDHFAGFQLTGRFHTPQLVRLMGVLPEGTTEFMCHPGRCGAELRSAPTRLKQSRERELEALIAPETRWAAGAAGVEIVSFRDL